MSQSRAAYRVDSNQPAIVRALRDIGASVTVTAGLGDGFPDILCGYNGVNYLFEIKATKRSKLTEYERAWHDVWHGTVFIVTSPEQAIEIVRTNPHELQY